MESAVMKGARSDSGRGRPGGVIKELHQGPRFLLPLQGLMVIVNGIPGPALAELAGARAGTSGAFSPVGSAAKQIGSALTEGVPKLILRYRVKGRGTGFAQERQVGECLFQKGLASRKGIARRSRNQRSPNWAGKNLTRNPKLVGAI